ncbi:MAG: ABC transporter substrate-binding protein [Sphingomonadaceae bacterium]
MKAVLALLLPLLLAACDRAPPAAPPPMPSAPAPQRIVSTNPCADALLWQLAEPSRILSISHWSHDPRSASVPLAWARHFPANGGTAEEILRLKPDLVLAGPHVAPATLEALRRLGIPHVSLPVPATVADSLAQVERLGAALGEPARAAALAREIEAALAAAAPPPGAPPIPALVWQGGGLVPGPGTLLDELMTRAGLANQAAAHGLAAWDVLDLERLVARPPALLLSGAPDANDRRLTHPAVATLRQRIATAPFPDRLMHCAGPTIPEAAAAFAAVRRAAG